MADGGPPAPQPPLAQPIAPSAQPDVLPAQPDLVSQLNWSHFKLELVGKPDKDAETHLLRTTNDCMDIRAFPEGDNIQRFCLTLVGGARLWYESLIHIALDWDGWQTQFRQQYSKTGNTREHLFHAWWSFHFYENSETLDSHVTCIRHVAVLLGYGEPQVLEAFKNILPSRLYWVLFPIEDLRQTVETANRILTKEKIDSLWVNHHLPHLWIWDGYNSGKKVVVFDTQDRLDEKLHKLTSMMSKLTV